MSRRRHIQKQPAVSLFPFLAVLICTMGALIVLLVVVVQQARKSAVVGATHDAVTSTHVSALPVLPDSDDGIVVSIPQTVDVVEVAPVASEQSLHQLEDIRWANEQLAKSREETRLDLEERRGALSRIEDQVRDLNDQLNLLESQAQALLDTEADKFAPSEKAAVELENVRMAVIETKKALAAKQEEAAKHHKKYAILSYEGRNGTRRRPIYIECKFDGVVLQPEGIRFGARDFSVLNAANPLAATLRAYREYLSNARLIESGGEPYPLIIVRPNGERAYAACKSALKSWDDEFGYELVPAEMELDFPPVDGGLAAFLREAVAAARLRLPANIAEPGAVASRVPILAAAGGPSAGPGIVVGSGATPSGGNSGQGGGARESRMPLAMPSAPKKEAPTYSLGKGIGGGLVLNSGSSSGRRSIDSGKSSRRREILRGARRASGQAGGRSANATYSEGNGFGGTGQFAGSSTGSNGDGAHVQASNNGSPQSASASGSNGVGQAGGGGNAASPGKTGGRPGSPSGPTGSSGPSGSSASDSVPMDSSPMRSAAGLSGPETDAGQSSMSFVVTIAEKQGANWALPNAADGSIGISRPIMAWFESNRIVVKSDRGQVAVPIENGSVDEAVQPLVTKVWKIIDGWGIAGMGAYWKPVIHVRVQAGAENGFERFSRLMQDSGLDIQRRK